MQKKESSCAWPSTTPTSIKQNLFVDSGLWSRDLNIPKWWSKILLIMSSHCFHSYPEAPQDIMTPPRNKCSRRGWPVLAATSASDCGHDLPQKITRQTTKLWLYCRRRAAHAQPPCWQRHVSGRFAVKIGTRPERLSRPWNGEPCKMIDVWAIHL